jgi:hypothetical protein
VTVRLSPRRVFAVTFTAIVLVQAAWILTVPAFRGSDEFDHVYKAAAVARGQWTARDPAPDGRGGIVTIPRDIVSAASPVCRFYRYTGHDNCYPIKPTAGRDVEVATAAGAYNPAYYLVTGAFSRPFHGAGVDYAMRVLTAIGCALLIAWAAAITARWATTAWPILMMSIGLTPVLLYSTAIAAPNGLTYASAALVWSVVIALSRPGLSQRGLAVPLSVGSVILVATHTTGILWLAFILLTALLLAPRGHWISTLVARPRTWALAATGVLVVIGLCVAWIRFARTNSLVGSPGEQVQFPWDQLPTYHARWALQAIGAFPLRNDPAPAPVYAMYGILLLAVLVALVRRASPRERAAAGAILLLLVLVPTVLTYVSYESEGIAWQGRYSLPLWIGITAIAGSALDRRPGPSPRLVGIVYVLVAAAMTTSTLHLGLREARSGPADPLTSAIPGGLILAGVLTIAGCLLPLLVLRISTTDHAPSTTSDGETTGAWA